MATAKQMRQTVDRCVNTMIRYHDAGRTRHTNLLMVAELQAHAAWVLDLGMDVAETVENILHPVETELIRRYGHELGLRFYDEFLRGFEGFLFEARAGGLNLPPSHRIEATIDNTSGAKV